MLPAIGRLKRITSRQNRTVLGPKFFRGACQMGLEGWVGLEAP
jgi:hypothetical protein